MRVVVAAPQVPFVRGGAELMAEHLVGALRERGHEAELVTVPFKWYPGARVLDQAFLWRLVDLTESDGRPIDRVIATKFPAYCVRHANKVAWVLHQFRQAYDYDGTELGQFGDSPEDRAIVRGVRRLDAVALGEARRVFATSRNVADRLQRFNGIEAELLPHPPQALPYRTAESEGYVLSVGRLDRAIVRSVRRLDAVALGEARRVFATSRNVADRLQRFNGIEAELLPHPPQALPYRTADSEGYVLSVGRLDRAKRNDLLVEAAKRDPSMRVVIAGEGPDRERLEQLAAGVNGRIELTGRVDDERLADLYARSLAVFYAPIDEDFGMVPYEAFLSGKPVVTTTDSGGPLEVVRDGETGVVVSADPAEIARACASLDPDTARRYGAAGKTVAERVTWDACVDALLS